MTILIDADGCPVVDLTLRSAGKKGVPVVILCDTSHRIEREGAQTLVFDKGSDSVDFALVNRVKPGDLVVTQDYGLASMCLAKCARVLKRNTTDSWVSKYNNFRETKMNPGKCCTLRIENIGELGPCSMPTDPQ